MFDNTMTTDVSTDMQNTGFLLKINDNNQAGSEIKILVISSFDGVNRQQRQLLEYALKLSDSKDPRQILVCFSHNPYFDRESKGKDEKLLSEKQRMELINLMVASGFSFVNGSSLKDNSAAVSSFEDAATKQLVSNLEVIVPGTDFLLSSRYSPINKILLQQLKKLDVLFDTGFGLNHEEDHSLLIYNAITQGRIEEANKLLGYSYMLKGRVVEGNRIGHTLGFPTANLYPDEPGKVIPAQGVYAAMVYLEGSWIEAMVNIGIRPTLDLENLTIEAHLLNFDENLYDKEITIHFIERIRDEMRFSSLSELKNQLHSDEKYAGKILKSALHDYSIAGKIVVLKDSIN